MLKKLIMFCCLFVFYFQRLGRQWLVFYESRHQGPQFQKKMSLIFFQRNKHLLFRCPEVKKINMN